MSSLGTVLNAFIAAAVGGIVLTELFKRTRERRDERPTVQPAAESSQQAS